MTYIAIRALVPAPERNSTTCTPYGGLFSTPWRPGSRSLPGVPAGRCKLLHIFFYVHFPAAMFPGVRLLCPERI